MGALLLAAAGEGAAIRFGSVPLALATVIWYGLAFACLAYYRLPLALIGLVVGLSLITVEVGVGDVEKTLSTNKVALAVVVAVWLVRRAPAVWSRLIGVPAVRWWILFLVVVLLSALRNGATIGETWGVLKQILYACVFLVALDTLGTGRTLLRRLLGATGFAAVAVAILLNGCRGYPGIPCPYTSSTARCWTR